MTLPDYAISIRQPWAWAIVHSTKRHENRSVAAAKHMTRQGPVCIHAAKGMTRDEYEYAARFMRSIGVDCPPPADLLRGGIIGTANIDATVKHSPDPWFFGPRALVLSAVQSIDFIPAVGALGLFPWRATPFGRPDPAKRWMMPAAVEVGAMQLGLL